MSVTGRSNGICWPCTSRRAWRWPRRKASYRSPSCPPSAQPAPWPTLRVNGERANRRRCRARP
eukprot:124876-Prymnesium_polylepis.1